MARYPNYHRAVQKALNVLIDVGIDSFPVSINKILKHYGIMTYTYETFSSSFSCDYQYCVNRFGEDGAALTKGGKYIIVYNQNQRPKNRIRFTLAHEIGHIILKHHEESGVPMISRLFGVESSLYAIMEYEANCFARNLLCPAAAARDVLRSYGFVRSEYDPYEDRTVWFQVSDKPTILTDHYLIQHYFMITDTAAKARCSSIKSDMRYAPAEDSKRILSNISYKAKWWCRICGEEKTSGAEKCTKCGHVNCFSLSVKGEKKKVMKKPAPPSPDIEGAEDFQDEKRGVPEKPVFPFPDIEYTEDFRIFSRQFSSLDLSVLYQCAFNEEPPQPLFGGRPERGCADYTDRMERYLDRIDTAKLCMAGLFYHRKYHPEMPDILSDSIKNLYSRK